MIKWVGQFDYSADSQHHPPSWRGLAMATSTRHHIKGGQNLIIDYSIMQSQEALGLIVEHPSPQKGRGGGYSGCQVTGNRDDRRTFLALKFSI